MKVAASEFRRMPISAKRSFELEAALDRRSKRCRLNRQIEELKGELHAKQRQEAVAESSSPPWRASLFGWTKEDLQHLDRLMHEGGFTEEYVHAERQKELHSPAIPPEEVRRRMLDLDDGAAEESLRECPSWIAGVCKNRDVFMDVLLVFGELPGGRTVVLGHGSQNPYWAVFTPLHLVSQCGLIVAAGGGGGRCRSRHKFELCVEQAAFLYEDDPLLRDPPTLVLPCLRFESGGCAWSDASPAGYEAFVEALPVANARRPGATKKKDRSLGIDATLVAKHPWIRRIVGKRSEHQLMHDYRVVDSAAGESEVQDLALVHQAVDDARLALAADAGLDQGFLVEPRGGAYTKKVSGMAIDSYRGRPQAGLPTDWVQAAWPHGARSVTCSVERYGAKFSIALCRVWCLRMQAWFDEWVEQDGQSQACNYSDLDLEALAPQELLADLRTLPESHPVQQRLRQICKMKPA